MSEMHIGQGCSRCGLGPDQPVDRRASDHRQAHALFVPETFSSRGWTKLQVYSDTVGDFTRAYV